MDIPSWHTAGLNASDVISLVEVAALPHSPGYAALRSYATGRREHALYGPMPRAAARIANRRIWLKSDIEEWLTCPIPKWHRSRHRIAAWIRDGRPRGLAQTGTTMSSDHGPRPTAP